MRPETAARVLATIGTFLLILAALLRLLSVYVLVSDPRLQAGAIQVSGPDPVMGFYAFSEDGRRVRFERGVFTDGIWQGGIYLLDLIEWKITPGDLPERPSLYRIENGQVRLNEPFSGSVGLSLSPPAAQVIDPILSADGQALAFIDQPNPNLRALYAVRGINPAERVALERNIYDAAWSPDKEHLLYIASRQGSTEIYLFNFTDSQQVRLTNDGLTKFSPRFSRDGRQIAYLAAPAGASEPDLAQFQPGSTPAANGVEVYVMNADGQNVRRLTETTQDEFNLAWTADNEVAYSAWQPDWPSVAYLYAIAPEGGESQRIYPPVAVESVTCRPALPGGSRAKVQILVSNDGKQAITVPLEVSANRQPLDLLTQRSQFRVQREEIALQPGENRTVEWMVQTPEDLKVYLSASIESGEDFPISARFCQITPRSMFLPRLPLLRTTLLLGLIGSIACIPWLRHARRRWLWVIWAAYGVLLLGLVAFESWMLLQR
jgi:hypothetical protein